MTKNITTNQAKKIITEHLKKYDITFTKLTVRTISFRDLARDKKIFVKIHGWKPCPALIGIKKLAKEHGFCIETDWKF